MFSFIKIPGSQPQKSAVQAKKWSADMTYDDAQCLCKDNIYHQLPFKQYYNQYNTNLKQLEKYMWNQGIQTSNQYEITWVSKGNITAHNEDFCESVLFLFFPLQEKAGGKPMTK